MSSSWIFFGRGQARHRLWWDRPPGQFIQVVEGEEGYTKSFLKRLKF